MFDQLREDIACIHERDPAARSRLEIITCYPGLHAIVIHRAAHWLWRHKCYWAGRFVSHLARIFTGIEIHPGAQLGRRVFIDHGFGVVIGETAVVGDDCTIYQGVTLGGTRLYKGEKRHPSLEAGVVVGAGAQILGGFTVGAGARVGSNAVVVKPVPAGATAVGNPARVIMPEDAQAKATDAPAAQPHSAAARPEPAAAQEATPCADLAAGARAFPAEELRQSPIFSNLASDADERAAASAATGFSAYGLGGANNDPLLTVLHELINHTAAQDARIQKLCQALDALGQKVENNNGQALDAARLNRLVE